MKQRMITSGIGLILFVIVVFLYETIVINIAIAVVAAVMVLELLQATGCSKLKFETVISLIFALLIIIVPMQYISQYLMFAVPLYVFILIVCMIWHHKAAGITHIALMFTISLLIPLAMGCLVWLCTLYSKYGIYYIFMAFGYAWLTDAGAYFIGSAIGKHKLFPSISPNKTWEGAIGGIITCVAGCFIVTWIAQWFFSFSGQVLTINYPAMTIISVIAPFISIIGDLFASLIKRKSGIKDFGSIMPGHGGMMDRFDSALLTIPYIFLAVKLFPIT